MPPERVLSRFVRASDLGDPKDLLQPFQGIVDHLDVSLPAAKAARETLEKFLDQRRSDPSNEPLTFPPDVEEARKLSTKAFYQLLAKINPMIVAGNKLFLAILQKLALAPALRKKVEKASRNYSKRVRVTIKNYGLGREIDQLKFFEKLVGQYQTDLALAKEAIVSGKEHETEGEKATKIKVGSFTVINTGGFSSAIMNNVVEIMTKVETLARSSGLGQVCYGEVQVTNTLTKGNTLAFYLVSKDALFIRANVKPGTDIVRTVLHELGHRYDHMFLKNPRGVERLYQILSGEEDDYKKKLREKKPELGQIWVFPKTKEPYRVKRIEHGRGGEVVVVEKVDNPRIQGRISLEGFLGSQSEESARDIDRPNFKGFVTPYAKSGGPTENFAEMFSFYCMSRLPVSQSVPFEALVFGGAEAANFRFARRVLARYVLGD